MNIFISLLSILVGTIFCFSGYKIFRIYLAVIGFIIGFLGSNVILAFFDIKPVNLVFSIIVGIIVAALFYLIYLIGIFLVTAITAYPIAIIILAKFGLHNYYFAVIFAILIGILALVLQKPLIIFYTAIQGGFIISSAIFAFLGQKTFSGFSILFTTNNIQTILDKLNQNLLNANTNILYLTIFLSLLGIITQFATNKNRKTETQTVSEGSPQNTPTSYKTQAPNQYQPPLSTEQPVTSQIPYQTQFCPECGKEINQRSEVCPNCFTKINKEPIITNKTN